MLDNPNPRVYTVCMTKEKTKSRHDDERSKEEPSTVVDSLEDGLSTVVDSVGDFNSDMRESMKPYSENPFLPKIGGRSNLPYLLVLSFTLTLGYGCPCCGNQVQDKRYKRRCEGNPLTVRSFTDTGITMQCRSCGLRFHFTWRNYCKVLQKYADNQPKKGVYDEQMVFHETNTSANWVQSKVEDWIMIITEFFNLNGESEKQRLAKLKERTAGKWGTSKQEDYSWLYDLDKKTK